MTCYGFESYGRENTLVYNMYVGEEERGREGSSTRYTTCTTVACGGHERFVICLFGMGGGFVFPSVERLTTVPRSAEAGI